MEATRRQATLFLKDNRAVEEVRRKFNLEQARIIEPHVTLCREDEVADWDKLAGLIEGGKQKSVVLCFGIPRREGNFVWLPCEDTSEFDRLRSKLLGASARKHVPHLTLVHPRNGICTDEIFDEITAEFQPFTHSFDQIAFIGQKNGGVWKILETFGLTKNI